MQGVHLEFKQLIRAIAPAANLFLLLSLRELRWQGLTFIAFYALQRTIQESEMTEPLLRSETGLKDYEVSRACGLLAKSGLVTIQKAEKDARVRLLKPTARGKRTHDQVLSAAARRFHAGVADPGRLRQLSEATQAFRTGNRILLGPLQLSFFDVGLLAEEIPKRTRAKRKTKEPADGRSKVSKPLDSLLEHLLPAFTSGSRASARF